MHMLGLNVVIPVVSMFLCVIVQEGFADYLDTALRATRRSQRRQQLSSTGSDQGASGEDNKTSLWNGALAAGAVAVGAMAALTLRQAFS